MISCGLDASTSCCGYAFTDENKEILVAGFLDLSKIEGNRAKSAAVISIIKSQAPGTIDRVNLEGALGGFSGPSSRTVVVMLARWNAVLEYALQDAFTCPVNLVNAITARKQLFGKGGIKGVKPKEYVKTMMDTLYDTTQWQKLNKIGNVDKRYADILDSIVISTYTSAK